MNSCLRYSDNWISSLSKIYKKINIEDKKIKILFLEEKNVDNINGELIEWINRKEINNIVKHTSNLDNVNLYIKSHPSKSKKDYENYNVKYLNNYSTFQCIDFCDIIICTISSAISDCFLLNKLIINLDYCHNFNSLIKKFNKDICVNSFEDYKKRIKYLTIDNHYKRKIEYKEIKKNLLFEYSKEDYQTYLDLFNY